MRFGHTSFYFMLLIFLSRKRERLYYIIMYKIQKDDYYEKKRFLFRNKSRHYLINLFVTFLLNEKQSTNRS